MLKLENGTNSFYQWDLDQRFIVTEIEGPATIHFWQEGLEHALEVDPYDEGGQTMAEVPNILLQKASPVTAYIYRKDIGAYTSYKRVFQVFEREKPAGYVYTETEARTWDALDERIKTLEENGTGGADITVDDHLDNNSTNPVQNKVLYSTLRDLGLGLESVNRTANAAQQAASQAQTTANAAGSLAASVRDKFEHIVEPRIATLETQVGDIDTTARNALTKAETAEQKAEQVETAIGEINATIGDIDTALDDLHTYAQSLMNGGDAE
jgi:hypothetical protein